MASIFTTGTINEANAAAVGQTMAETIRDDIEVHVSWTLAEEYNPGTICWYVFKSDGDTNDLGADWFFIIGRTIATGELRFSICEEYDAVTHTASHFPVAGVNNNLFDANGCHPSAYVLGVANLGLPDTPAVPAPLTWTPGGASAHWWLIVDGDLLTAAFNGVANAFFHAGAYAYLGQLTNDLPLQITGSSSGSGFIARNPALAGELISVAYSMAMQTYSGGNGAGSYSRTQALGFGGSWEHDDKLQGDQRPVAEVAIRMNEGGPSDFPSVYGWALGKQKRMRYSGWASPAGMAFGDAFVMNGTLWVPWYPSDGRIFDTGVASA